MSAFKSIVRAYEVEKEEVDGRQERSLFVTPFVTLSEKTIAQIQEKIEAQTKDGAPKIGRWPSAMAGLFAALAGSIPGAFVAELANHFIKLPPEIIREAALASAAIIGTWSYVTHRQSSIDQWIAARHAVATGRRPFEERDLPNRKEADRIRVQAGLAPVNI